MASDNGFTTTKFTELRKRAQEYLSAAPQDAPALPQEDVKKLVEELNTYQIELELQNEDLRKTQQELEQSRHRVTDLYDFAPVGHLTVGDKGLIVESNLTAADMLGVSRGLLLNQTFSAFIIDEDQDSYYRCREKRLHTKEPQTCELRMKKRDGTIFHAQLKSTVRDDIDGKSGQFRIVLADITLQKNAEYALVKAKNEWEKTFDAISDIITLMDKDLRIVRANKAAHDFFKVKPGELNGLHCYKLFRGDSSPCLKCPIIKTLHDTTQPCSEIIFHKKLEKIFHVSSAPLFDENGELQHLVHIAKDITETKRLEENLLQSRKMEAMGTLAGGIAHDFNNILTAIIGYADLIRDALPESSPLKSNIEHVLTAGNRAKELVKQILAFSRKRHGQNTELLEPQIVVREVLRMLRATLPASIELKENIDSNCSAISIDPTQFHQIIVNICTNAFQAIENQQGTITVQLSDTMLSDKEVRGESDVYPGLFVELLVKDTGIGMDRNAIDRIFEPYYTTKDFGKGSGIGLAVVFGIIKSHGGMVKTESEVGRGSTFRVYFPATERQKQKKEEKEVHILPTGTERILIVDDEEMIVRYLKEYLENLGYTVTTHTESSEALEDFISHPSDFDLVITDMTMPKIPGSELSKKMLEKRHDIPIILCTGYSSIISEDKAREIGIKRFAMKPVNRDKLATMVREVLDKNKS